MPLVNSGIALSQVRGFRMCWLPGRFGGGKSSMSFALAYKLAQNYGYRIVSNTDCVWNETAAPDWLYDDRGNMVLKVVMILDEGGMTQKSEHEAMEYMAFAGKMDVVTILPSITEPADIFQSLTIQPTYNFRSIGVPINVYEWRVNLKAAKFSGSFQWWGMEEIYGAYSTLNPSYDPRGLTYWLRTKVHEYKQYYMERNKISSWQEEFVIRAMAEENAKSAGKRKGSRYGGGLDETDQNVLLANAVFEASKKIERSTDTLEAVSERTAARDRDRRGWRR